ncbi:hypothetical protein SAMN04488133_2561 [Halobellus limi]|uniref:Uncharacterized protein n=1 Tax=Halobellus limi TaxID=699433 RepID=A0A1H6AWG9_9EURY|nr:hypothetical protein SAMN04488133_2561 [Halobellus limi]
MILRVETRTSKRANGALGRTDASIAHPTDGTTREALAPPTPGVTRENEWQTHTRRAGAGR